MRLKKVSSIFPECYSSSAARSAQRSKLPILRREALLSRPFTNLTVEISELSEKQVSTYDFCLMFLKLDFTLAFVFSRFFLRNLVFISAYYRVKGQTTEKKNEEKGERGGGGDCSETPRKLKIALYFAN